jgi:nucleotide-binding universal stress UspA family protein
MSIRQILRHAPAFPDPVADSLLEGAVCLAHLLGSSLTAQVAQLDSNPASFRPILSGFIAGYREIVADLAADSEKNAAEASDKLVKLCKQNKVALDMRRDFLRLNMPETRLIDLARLHDLVALPAPGPDAMDFSLAHSAIFRTGRPVLLFPRKRSLAQPDRVIVGWDFSREAARALKDAVPVLKLAKDIHIVGVTGEKEIVTTATATDLEKFMHAHGLSFHYRALEKQRASVTEQLFDQAREIDADLLVMGAYGHSRFSEFVLGGATLDALDDPPLPILLSH